MFSLESTTDPRVAQTKASYVDRVCAVTVTGEFMHSDFQVPNVEIGFGGDMLKK